MSGSNDPSKASTSKDVTRGGVQRRVFTPKIPARREKKEATEPAENASKPAKRDQGRPPRGRGNQRVRQRPEIITEKGIFEDMFAGGMARRPGSSSSMPSMKSELGVIKREKIELGATKSDIKMKGEPAFLRDDFISDHKDEEFDWGPQPLVALAGEAMKQLSIADVLQDAEEHGRFLLIHLPDEELPPKGKLRVFESGTCRIEGGAINMGVQVLDDCDFHQEAVIYDNNGLHVLGKVDPSLFFIPDFFS